MKSTKTYKPRHEKTCLCHMRTTKAQISCLDNIISLVSVSKISSLLLVSVAEQAGLSINRSQSPNTGFLVTWLICEEFDRHVQPL